MTKRIFLSIIIVLLAFNPVLAQKKTNEGTPLYANRWKDYQRNSYFGLRFGLNVPTLRYKGTGGVAQTNPLPRFHVGLVWGHKLGDGLPFFFETGLVYTEKGTEIKATEETGLTKSILRYMEVPITLKYKLETNVDDLVVQPFFGGFLAYGIGGETKDYDKREKHSPFGSDRYKSFDAGIRLGCGLSFQNFYFEMGYDIGLFNVAGKHYSKYSYDSFDGHIRSGNFFMSLGVDF